MSLIASVAEPETGEGTDSQVGGGGLMTSHDCTLEDVNGEAAEDSGKPGHRALEANLLTSEHQLFI